jgi:hypothetical protein
MMLSDYDEYALTVQDAVAILEACLDQMNPRKDGLGPSYTLLHAKQYLLGEFEVAR